MHFPRKNSAQIDHTLTLNANQNRLKKSMKKSMKNDAKIDLKMYQKWIPKRPNNPTISRQDPDTPNSYQKSNDFSLILGSILHQKCFKNSIVFLLDF